VKKAFSLAETAVALSILGLLLLFVLNLFPSAMLARRNAEQRLVAQSLARSYLEQQMEVSFGLLHSGQLAELEREGVRYRVNLEVSESPQARPEYLKILKVVVQWSTQGRTLKVERQLYRHRLPHQVSP
jgi:type II secretory pathway pseudopilin PulG